jgi:hypothetical protein
MANHKKDYGIHLKARPEPRRPVAIELSTADGSRMFTDAVKRVIATHAQVLQALAKR